MHISKEVYCLFAKGVCVHSEEMDVPSWRDLTYSKVHVQNKIIIAREKQIYYRQKYKYLSAKIFQDDNFSY